MPTLTIDNQTVTVPEGANVLEAAKALGIVVPHFCYHEALGSVGACRQCAVVFLDGPVKGLQMSCMVKAQDGMVVSTLEKRAVEFRQRVAEWLMTNHPHDCPVCDEGGECLLQDMTVAAGHTIRRYRGRKRTYNNQYLGPFLWHEMNRCIQCYRCVRTYRDYCGGDDFGVLGCNQRIYFGRFQDGRLTSPFSGNLADLCPTGVFTDKTFRYRARYWDLQEAPSVCPHCSLGCATVPGARYRELQRVRAGTNREVNGWMICDRGRFGYGYANHPERPRLPRLADQTVGWPEALADVCARLQALAAKDGAGALAFLASPRASLEANYLLRTWAREFGSDRIAFDPHPGHDRAARIVAAQLGKQARSLREIRQSDCLLFVGVDPLNEGPGLALSARQAIRRGGTAAILDPRPVELPFEAVHLPLAPERLGAALGALANGDFKEFSRQETTILEGIAARLRQAKNPILAGGVDLLGAGGIDALLAAARAFDQPERPCGATVLLGGPNSYGGALLAGDGPDFATLLTAIEAGEVKALVCLESDPFGDHPDPRRVRAALAKLDLLVLCDYLPTATTAAAHILLPTRAPAESAGTFVNQEGRMLSFASAFEPGVPIEITGDGDHPPRRFEALTPGSEPRQGWELLAALLGQMLSLQMLRRRIETEDARFAGLTELDPEGTGRRVAGSPPWEKGDSGGFASKRSEIPPAPLSKGGKDQTNGGAHELRLLAAASLFGSEAIAAFSPVLDEVRPAAHVLLHLDDAARLGLAAGDRVRLRTERGDASVTLELTAAMAPGLAIVPHRRGSDLEFFVPGGPLLACRLTREEAP